MVVSAISLFSGYCNFLQQASLARGDQYSLARSLNGRHALKLKKRDLRKSIFCLQFLCPKDNGMYFGAQCALPKHFFRRYQGPCHYGLYLTKLFYS